MILPYSGCFTRRSTRTTTVLSVLSDTMVPVRTRLGIFLYSSGLSRLGAGAFVLKRPDAGDGAAHLAHPRRLLDLVGRRLEAQVELLALELGELLDQLIVGAVLQFVDLDLGHGLRVLEQGFTEAGDHLGLDRQLLGGAFERHLGDRAGNAVQLEQDAAGLDAADPIFGRALARAHPYLGRLRRHRHVRENADPQPPLALDVARDRAARRLDLARGDPLRLHRLEAVGAEVQGRAALGVAVDAALVRLAELRAFGLQHFLLSQQSVSGGHHGPGERRRFEPPSSAGPGRADRGPGSRP